LLAQLQLLLLQACKCSCTAVNQGLLSSDSLGLSSYHTLTEHSTLESSG
jgi:hypothetical protein